MEVQPGMKNGAMLNPACREQLARRLSRNGRFTVCFVSYPNFPEVFEFIARPTGKRPVRYINAQARPGAKLSRLL